MRRRSASPILILLVVISFILQCQLPPNPADPSNTSVELLIRNSLWLESNLSITDTVDKPIQIGLVINLPENIDSIKVSVKAEGKALFDTLFRSFSTSNRDTIWKVMSFPDTGYKLVSVVPYSKVVNLLPISAGITIVKKTSTLQPDNHPPKWSGNMLNVALNDTTRYELNLSPLCSDPDKDVLGFSISGKALPGDTIIGNLYTFQASTATIGKNSVELIASDSSGLKDTFELVLNVTASGTDNNVPEVTILAPDKDSSVTNSETCVVDLLCSDASGIDSVYAIFNSKTIPAVLENGHYKISITGLIAGVYNAILITVRDKSISALKTTKTIKIKYVQTFGIAYNGNGNSSGVIPIDTGKYETGATATVKGNSGNLEKIGYVFAGWNTASDGSGTTYGAEATLKMGTGNVTLFAKWTTNPTYTVTYDANTGSGTAPSDVTKYEAGALVTVQGPSALIKTGHTFNGWNTAADGSGTARAATTTFNMPSANVILYAQWKLKQYGVIYDANEASAGTPPSDASKHDTGTTVTVAGNTGGLVKIGCTFDGWNTAADGKGTTFAAGTGTFVITGDTKLFARWTLKKYKLSYNGNGNNGGEVPDEVSYDSNTTVTVSGNTNSLTKTGFDFNGWNTKANGSGVVLGAGSTFKIKSDTTLYAQWTVKKYNLTIETPVNGTTNLSGIVSVDSAVAKSITATPSSGYKFKCWRLVSGTAIIADTTSATTTVTLTSGNATVKAVFVCLTFIKQLSMAQYSGLSIKDIIQVDDGNYMLAGQIDGGNGIVMKLDLNGDTVWTRTFPAHTVSSINKASGGCSITGSSVSAGDYAISVHFYQLNGNQQRDYEYFQSGQPYYGSVTRRTSDNGYIIGGTSTKFFLAKTDAEKLNNSWSFEYSYGSLYDCVQTSDGGYMMAGTTYKSENSCITKVNSQGKQEWQNYFDSLIGGGRYSAAWSIENTTDGDCVIGGSANSAYLLKVSQAGQVKLFKSYSNVNSIISIQPLSDGYFIAGTTTVIGSGMCDFYIAKVNSSGAIVKETAYGTAGADEGCSGMNLTNDGGCIMVGGNWVIKTDENGEVK